WQILQILDMQLLESRSSLTLLEISEILADSSPYTSAKEKTWRLYARILANWMDTADLAIFDSNNGILERYKTGTEVRERPVLLTRRRSGMTTPWTQYTPVEKVAIRLVEALQKENRVDWTGTDLGESTISRALATLETLGFISRKTQSIEV